MKITLQMLAFTLVVLLIGGWLPGGTWWLTPIASVVLIGLVFFGRQSPLLLLAMLNGEWRGVRRLAGAHFGARLMRLTLLALPVWLAQCETEFDGNIFSHELPIAQLGKAPSLRETAVSGSLANVWGEALTKNRGLYDTVRVTISTPDEYVSLMAQAHYDDWLFGYSPPVRVGWSWTNLDLLPDLQVIVGVPTTFAHGATTKVLYVSAGSADIDERSTFARYGWDAFLLSYPVLALVMAIWGTVQIVRLLGRFGRVSSPVNS